MYGKSISAMVLAMRLLVKRPRVFGLMLAVYAGMLGAVYLFVSTREATISQLVVTLVVVIAAPALFFVLQAVGVSYAGSSSGSLVRKIAVDWLKLIVVSLPVIALTLAGMYALHKIQAHLTIATALRYLLIAVVAPLFAIQLWIATSDGGLRSLVKSLRGILAKTLAPQSVFVYACGFLFFAVVPYLLLHKPIPVQRAWLEISVLVVRLAAAAVLIFLGWVTTVGAISIISRNEV